MKHLPKWLENSLSRPKKDAAEDQPNDPGEAEPGERDVGVDLPNTRRVRRGQV